MYECQEGTADSGGRIRRTALSMPVQAKEAAVAESPHTVSDVMTLAAVAVGRRASYKEMVELMREWNISAMPVLEGDGRVIGVPAHRPSLAAGGRTDTGFGGGGRGRRRRADPRQVAGDASGAGGGEEADRSEPTGEPLTARTLMTSPALCG